MFISLKSLFEGGDNVKNLDYSFDFSKHETSDGLRPFTSPVMVQGEIAKRSDVVTLEAKVFFSYTADCDRCCEETTIDYEMPMNYTLVTSLNSESGDSESKYVNEYIVLEDMQLELDALVLEDIFLFLPIVHLCDDDCEGLCPKCGANLNYGDCQCKKDIDPRLEGLLDFLE